MQYGSLTKLVTEWMRSHSRQPFSDCDVGGMLLDLLEEVELLSLGSSVNGGEKATHGFNLLDLLVSWLHDNLTLVMSWLRENLADEVTKRIESLVLRGLDLLLMVLLMVCWLEPRAEEITEWVEMMVLVVSWGGLV